MLGILLTVILFISLPVIMIMFLISGIRRYISAKRQNRECPGTFPEEEIKWRKTVVIVCSVVVGVIAAAAAGIIWFIVVTAASI